MEFNCFIIVQYTRLTVMANKLQKIGCHRPLKKTSCFLGISGHAVAIHQCLALSVMKELEAEEKK
uniref:Uncharacterized protein n=1 Tax=Rhizophora mucronata TaxID=61149 RepID=A0A2P2PZE1_RHIMU